MTHCIAHNISSPLGWTSEENFAAVLQGRTKLATHKDKWALPQSFVASLFDDNAVEERFNSHVGDVGLALSRFEMLVVLSVKQAAEQAQINLSSSDVGIVLATTKGNVELLSPTNQRPPRNGLNILKMFIKLQHGFEGNTEFSTPDIRSTLHGA